MMLQRRKILLDVDTGTDDAVAIMLAALHPGAELLACTTVNGNLPVEECTINTLNVLGHIGRSDIPVYQGASRPLVRTDLPVPRAHRKSSGIHVRRLPLPDTDAAARPEPAVVQICRLCQEHSGNITLVAVGPLTNIAMAVLLDPDIVSHVDELVIMGGGHAVSNVTASAEFNIWADPDAASCVFTAGFPSITLITLDATHQALITDEECERLNALGTPASTAAALFIRQRINGYNATQPMSLPDAAPLHDAVCIAYCMDKNVVSGTECNVTIERAECCSLGQSIIDVNNRSGKHSNSYVALHSDKHRFFHQLMTTFSDPA